MLNAKYSPRFRNKRKQGSGKQRGKGRSEWKGEVNGENDGAGVRAGGGIADGDEEERIQSDESDPRREAPSVRHRLQLPRLPLLRRLRHRRGQPRNFTISLSSSLSWLLNCFTHFRVSSAEWFNILCFTCNFVLCLIAYSKKCILGAVCIVIVVCFLWQVTIYRCLEGGLVAVLQAYVDEDVCDSLCLVFFFLLQNNWTSPEKTHVQYYLKPFEVEFYIMVGYILTCV